MKSPNGIVMTLTIAAAINAGFVLPCDQGLAAGATKVLRQTLFDSDTRKKTKSVLTDAISYSAYANARFIAERNRRLNDGVKDGTDEGAAHFGLAVRADPTDRLTGFIHGEAVANRTTARTKPTNQFTRFDLKEANISYQISAPLSVSVGRMRFSDTDKWVIDGAVDGVHLGFTNSSFIAEIAATTPALTGERSLLVAHVGQIKAKHAIHGYAIAETAQTEQRLHLATSWVHEPSDRLSYVAHAGTVIGDAANSESTGFGFDVRARRKIGTHVWNPQITLGVAAGTPGFAQSQLQSNKTYDGGQMQFHRYGYVYQPRLTNIAVATVSVGVRPSRQFSLDLGAHAYAQLDQRAEIPEARVRGATTGRSRLLGVEASVVGAWRPTRTSKLEIGAGIFQAGSAYADRATAKRVFTRVSFYF